LKSKKGRKIPAQIDAISLYIVIDYYL